MIRRGLTVVALAALLAGCNGKEDFSDAVVSGDPLGSGVGAGANFNADDACAPRVVGVLVDAGVVSNVRYQCDGFYGYTGVTGIEEETSQNFFVCPMGARSVTFMLGGRTASLSLGTGYFRPAQSINAQGCQYDYGEEEYVIGQYDADGVYLFTLSDLIDGPARVDAESDPAGTDEKKRIRNGSALLQALDTTPGDELITIDQVAHEIVFDSEAPFVFPAGFLSQDYATFIQGAGTAQAYLDAVEAGGGVVSTAGFPLEPGTISALGEANRATNAGIYRFQLIQNSIADPVLADPDVGIYTKPVLFGDGLCQAVAAGAINPDPESPEEAIDTVLLPSLADYLGNAAAFCASYSQFMPSMLVTRRGHVAMGGAFNINDFENGQSFACANKAMDYAAFTSDANAFSPDRIFSDWDIAGNSEGGSLKLKGRFIGDHAFNGEEREGVFASDYTLIYPNLPDAAYDFNAATDRTSLNGTFCNAPVTDQPLLSLLRAGTVSPSLDAAVMTALADPQPMQYTLSYIARAQASDEEPNTESASLKITIHSDGAIFTDLDGNGNTTYDGTMVPAGEYEIGMVSSVFRSTVTPADPTLAVLNIIVHNYGPLSASSELPKYGSHFRSRLVPNKACGENSLFVATGDFETVEESAYWFDPYAATDVIRSNATGEAAAAGRYAGLRTRAYGYVEATRTDCP